MKTILQIIPSMGAGGAEQACYDVAVGLKNAGHRPIVISSGGRRARDLEDKNIWHVTHVVNSKNPLTIFRNGAWLANFIQENKVDVIHARSRAPAWSALIASRRTKCPFVTTFHAAYKYDDPFKKFYNSVMTRSDRIIAISEYIAKRIKKDYGVSEKKIRVIPRGINLENYQPEKITQVMRDELLDSWEIDNSRPIALLPGRVSPIKGHKVFIKAMAILAQSSPNLLAVILGDAQGRVEYVRELHHLITELNLRDNIRIVSHSDDMPTAYSVASIVVAPSLVPEGFGRVPVEAMAMNKPVIASDLGGYSENIRHGETGWLVPPQNPEALADTILQALHQTPEERKAMIDAGMQEVHTRYDKHKMVADTLAVYEEVIAAKRL